MLSSLLFGFLLLMGVVLFVRWFTTAAPVDVMRALKWSGFALVMGLTVVLAVSGRLGWALAALSALVPWITRAFCGCGCGRCGADGLVGHLLQDGFLLVFVFFLLFQLFQGRHDPRRGLAHPGS